MRVSKAELPVVAETGDYTGAWAELGDMHYAFETCAAGYDMDALVKIFPGHACPVEHIPRGHRLYMLAETELLQLTRKSEHNELVRKFAAAGLFPSE